MNWLLSHWQYFAFPLSGIYTFGSALWTIRAERLLRQLRTEQRIQGIAYDELHQDFSEVQDFLENGNTLRRIPAAPLLLIKKCPK